MSFGPFAFDRQSRLLWRDGVEIALPPRVLGVLELLMDRQGQVVARQDLLDGVWKDAFVTDTSLAEAVSFLRQALGDDPQSPRYIQTVHRRGYRFLPRVTEEPAAGGLTPAVPEYGVRPRSVDYPLRPSIAGELLPWSIAVLCAALAAAAVWRVVRQPDPEAPPLARFSVQPAPGTAFDSHAPAIAVSADGGTIAWAACETISGLCGVYTRAIDRIEITRLPGSDGASAPFFSPDGRWIGFFADGKLKKIAASGGSASILADALAPGGGSWAPDGQIAFAGTPAGGLLLVSDQGGPAMTLTMPRGDRGEVRHLYPAWLPDGGLVFTITCTVLPGAPGELAALARGARTWKTLRAGVGRAAVAAPGYLLISSGSDLQAVTFDERTLTLTGTSDSVLASVTGGDGIAHFATGGGTIAAIPAAPAARATWADGVNAASLARLSSIAISPDSRRAAGVLTDGASSDIWVADIASGALKRLTYGGTNVSPTWSADSSRVYFATRGPGAFGIAWRRADDPAPAQAIATGPGHVFPSSVAADGRIAVTTTAAGGHTGAGILPGSGGTVQVFQSGPFDEANPAFSPDGLWIALESNESGRTEIVVRDARAGRRSAVSVDGGSRPRWSADGRSIYFDSGRRLMRASFDGARGAMVRSAEAIFDRADARVVAVTPSGRLLLEPQTPSNERTIVVLQWLRELRQRLPLPVIAPR